MARVIHNQTNFTAGELSPRMKGRGDVARYQHGAETIENGIVVVHGGIERRPGQRYLAEAKLGGARTARLIPYVFNVEHAYLLEFGHEYVRVFEASTGAVVLTTALAVLEVASPYTDDQLPAITWKQEADVMQLYHPDVPTQELRRLSATHWILRPVRWIVEPFAEIGHFPDAGLTIDDAAVGTGRTFTTSAVTVPGAPTSPVATARNTGASVTFTAPASVGGDAIDSYTVTADPGGATGTGPGTTVVVAGLTNGVSYTFTVTAHNKAGNSAASVASNAVVPATGLPGASITATVDPLSFFAVRADGSYAVAGPTASGSGGVAPYTVHWSRLSGDPGISIEDADSAQVVLRSGGYGTRNYISLRATVTDAVGASGTHDCTASVNHRTGKVMEPLP